MTRIIHISGHKYETEELVYFTEDLELKATDLISWGYDIISDEVYDIDLPTTFPMDKILKG